MSSSGSLLMHNKVHAANNHAEYLEERQKMMQHRSYFLDACTTGGKVIFGKFGKEA